MKRAIEFFKEFWKEHAIVVTIASMVFGGVVTDFFKFRDAARQNVQVDFERVKASQPAMDHVLQIYADKARGLRNTGPQDLAQLQDNIKLIRFDTQQIVIRIPALKSKFEALSDALIALQEAAEEMTGPGDGKAFVAAVKNYYLAMDSFNEEAAANQNRWI